MAPGGGEDHVGLGAVGDHGGVLAEGEDVALGLDGAEAVAQVAADAAFGGRGGDEQLLARRSAHQSAMPGAVGPWLTRLDTLIWCMAKTIAVAAQACPRVQHTSAIWSMLGALAAEFRRDLDPEQSVRPSAQRWPRAENALPGRRCRRNGPRSRRRGHARSTGDSPR